MKKNVSVKILVGVAIAIGVFFLTAPVLLMFTNLFATDQVLVKMEGSTDADLTIKITGHQWKWEYEYLGLGIGFESALLEQDSLLNNLGTSGPAAGEFASELQVDNMLVVPTGRKIRVLLTSNDVIHAWWVPAFGAKKDAIPGYINELWFNLEPGKEAIYRGGCAELCGQGHAFMPVVVNAVSSSEFDAWVAAGGNHEAVVMLGAAALAYMASNQAAQVGFF